MSDEIDQLDRLAHELAESWINGNQTFVVNELLMPDREITAAIWLALKVHNQVNVIAGPISAGWLSARIANEL